MLGRHHRFVSALASLAVLVFAVSALAGREDSAATSMAVQASRPVQPEGSLAGSVSLGVAGTFQSSGTVVQARYFRHRFGFYPYWDPFWYPDPWFYGWYAREPGYLVQPAVPKDQVLVTMHIKPAKAAVTVDGKSMGTARDFDSVSQPLWLKPGEHVIEIGKPGYQTLRLSLDLEGGRAYELNYGLNKGQGVDNRSSEPEQTPGPTHSS